MQNRLQALLITALMVWTLAAPAMGVNPFYDVPEDHWAYDSVEYLAEAGLVEGYPDGSFGGSRNFTRYEMALVFARIVARFEQYVDQMVAQGIDSRLEELTDQVATAMKDAADALAAAREAQDDKEAERLAQEAMEVAIGTLEAIDARGWDERIQGAEDVANDAADKAQEALETAQKALEEARLAMDVAVGTLEAIDARGWEAPSDDSSAQAIAAAKAEEALAVAEQALAAAEKAMVNASESMDVAVGTLDAIDARDFDGRIDAAASQADAAASQADAATKQAEEAIAVAGQALATATDAMSVAVGTLDAIDARAYDSRIDGAASQADEALALAKIAVASAQEAIEIATGAMDVAVGTLHAIDARQWDAQISEAMEKADEALRLARSIAVVEPTPVTPSETAPRFNEEARAVIEEIATAIVIDRLAEVKANADKLAGEVGEIRTDVDAAKALIASESTRLEKAILDLTNEFSTELEILGVRVARLEAKFTALEGDVAALDARIAAVEGDVATVDGRVTAVAGDVAAVDGRVTEVAGDVAAVDGRVTEVAGDVAAVDGRVTEVAGDVAAVDGRVTEVAGDVAAVDGRVTEVAGDVAAVDGRVDGVDGRVTLLEGAASASDSRITAVDGRVDEIEGRVDGVDGRVGALEQGAAETDARISAIDGRVSAVDGRVTLLDGRVVMIDDEVKLIRAELDRYSLSGFNESTLIYGTRSGSGQLNDPRDPDSGAFVVPRKGGVNRLQLRLDGKVNEQVDLAALLDFVYDTRPTGDIVKDSAAWVEITTDQPVRLIRLGTLDNDRVAKSFSSALLDADEFGNSIGGFTNVVLGSLDSDIFLRFGLDDRLIAGGAAGKLALSPQIDVELGGVHVLRRPSNAPRTGISVGAVGNFDDLNFNTSYALDVENSAVVHDTFIELPLESALVGFTLQRIDSVWSSDENTPPADPHRLPFASEILTRNEAIAEKLAETRDKVVDINQAVFADEAITKGRVDLPVGSFMAFGQIGSYTSSLDNGQVDSFNQFGLYDLDLFGFQTEITRSNFLDEADRELHDQRLSLTTRFEDIDMKADIHLATGAQIPVFDVGSKQRHFMLSLVTPVQILVPWTGSLDVGTSLTANNPLHSAYKLAVEGHQVTPTVTIGAEIGAENNVITDNRWRLNSSWTGQNQTTRAINAAWQAAEPLNLTAGYRVVNNSATGLEITQDAGVEYLMAGAFGGDLTLGYGYRVVRTAAGVDGTPRNVLSAEYIRTQGDFTLSANAKRYIGARASESGNEFDTVASMKLIYPVFQGANITVDGKYVSSEGTKAPDYRAGSLSAGLRFDF